MAIVLISCPISNRPTQVSARAGYMLYWRIKEMYPDVDVQWLPDDMSIHKHATIINELSQEDAVLFVYLGHGKPQKMCGRIPPGCGTNPSLVDEDNVGVLNNVITYAVACWTGAGLGRLAENAGVRNYIGYRKPIYVAYNMDEHNYREDIIDVWHTFPLRLLDGDTSARAVKKMEGVSIGYEKYYRDESERLMHGEFFADRFRINRTALMSFGDVRAMI